MYDSESEANGEGDQAAADVHVVLVRHWKTSKSSLISRIQVRMSYHDWNRIDHRKTKKTCEDDYEQQEGANDLVRCQGVERHLFYISINRLLGTLS